MGRRALVLPELRRSRINSYRTTGPSPISAVSSAAKDFELQGQKRQFRKKINDGAFGTMCKRLASDSNPNLILMNYDLARLSVTNLFFVPRHFFIRDIIQERKPLAPTAKRAGWIGCNILLGEIPAAGKIFLVRGGEQALLVLGLMA